MKQSGKLTLANGTTFTGSWQGTVPVKGEVVFFTVNTVFKRRRQKATRFKSLVSSFKLWLRMGKEHHSQAG